MVRVKKAKVSPKKTKAALAKKPLRKVALPKITLKKVTRLAPKAKEVIRLKRKIRAKKPGPPKARPSEKNNLAQVLIERKKEEIKEAKVAIKESPPLILQEPAKLKKEIPPSVKKEIPPEKKTPPLEVVVAPELKELELQLPITLKDLAVKLQEKPSTLIKILMALKMMVGINQALDESMASTLCAKFGFRIIKAPDKEELVLRIHQDLGRPEDLKPRPPIITFMGHVDHGKTSLLDAIRKTKVAESEHGGITQHIGAYRVVLTHGEITFLDTPGHEAFTAMRARGASITDIVVLVVAADDGVMPQTKEAIDHARAAEVPIVVAINKIDKPQANIDQVKKQLSELELTAEDWGGKTITVPVSAKTGEGIDDLLEMILLEAQMLELKANPQRPAKGVVIEAKLSKGRGPVSTLLIQNGTLHLNDNIIVGQYYGKIRAMFNDLGQPVTETYPAFAVEVLGIFGVPAAGEPFFTIADEKLAKELALERQEQEKGRQIKPGKRISLEDLYVQIKEGRIKELKLIIKADVQGSLAAIKEVLSKLNVSEIKLDVIHEGVGNINTSDAVLAMASNALILGFNVSADERAKELSQKEGIDIRTYNIIYELGNDIKAAIEGMLEPKLKKVFLGRAEVRKVFKVSRAGTVAGCFVTKGNINRASLVNLIRNGEVVFEGKLASLKRFKDDVREVAEGFECGMALGGFEDFQEGDIIEAYEVEKIARKL